MKKRIQRLIIIYSIVLVIGITYGIVVKYTSFGIPCVIHLIFDVNCPGCGISRFISNCIAFNFGDAIAYNYMGPFIVAFIIYVCVTSSIHYVKTGKGGTGKINKWVALVFLILLIVWTVIRNIYHI